MSRNRTVNVIVIIAGLLMTSAILIPHFGIGVDVTVDAKKRHSNSNSLPTIRESESGSSSSSRTNPIIFLDRPTPNSDAQIMDGVSIHKGGFLGTTIIGEVKNNGADAITYPKITATYYNAQNQTIGTDFTFTDPINISTGSSAPFNMMVQSPDVLKDTRMIKLHLDFQ